MPLYIRILFGMLLCDSSSIWKMCCRVFAHRYVLDVDSECLIDYELSLLSKGVSFIFTYCIKMNFQFSLYITSCPFCIFLGSFLLHGYTVIDCERPADRPLGFIFCPPEPVASTSNPDLRARGKTMPKAERKKTQMPGRNRTCVVCTFQPEMGSKTIEVTIIYIPGDL